MLNRSVIISVTLLAVAVLVAACSDGGRAVPAVTEYPAVTGSGDLPSPGALKELSSVAPGGGYLTGEDFDQGLPCPGCEDGNGRLTLQAADAEGLAFACYCFQLQSADQQLDIDWSAKSGSYSVAAEEVQGEVYVGLADYEADQWDWFDITADIPAAGSLEDYITDGRLVVVIASISPCTISIESLRAHRDWVVEEIELPWVWSDLISADLDSNDRVHIINSNHYIRNTPEGWITEDLEDVSGADIGSVHQLVLDEHDTAHICSYKSWDWGIGNYQYYTNSGPGWERQWGIGTLENNPIDRPSFSGNYNWICFSLDSSNQAHFAYFMEKERDLYYAGPNGDRTWTTVLVDADGETGEQSWIILDNADIPHIVYHANDHSAGRHAWLEDGTWYTEELFDGFSDGVDVGLTADNKLLAGFDVDPGAGYPAAAQLFTQGSGWQSEELGYCSGGGCFLELASTGMPTLVYRRYSSQPLRIESWTGTEWEHGWVDLPDENPPTYPVYDVCFMLDSQDRPHIVYAEEGSPSDRIIYAHRQ